MSPSFVYITCGCSQCLLYHFHAAQNSLHGRKLLLKFLVFLCQPQHLMRMQELVAKVQTIPGNILGLIQTYVLRTSSTQQVTRRGFLAGCICNRMRSRFTCCP